METATDRYRTESVELAMKIATNCEAISGLVGLMNQSKLKNDADNRYS